MIPGDAHGSTDAVDAAAVARWLRRGMLLVMATMAYNAVEAGIGLWAGLRAGSIALVGFSLDSVIEIAAAAVVLWRLRLGLTQRSQDETRRLDRIAIRFVGTTFLLLATYVTIDAIVRLTRDEAAGESTVGIVLASVSLVVMPVIAAGKFRVAHAVNSAALRAEAKETLACSYLSFTLLLGLVANAWRGLTWADPVAALLMVPWLVHEGREAFDDD